jgi:hypothetical protein
MSEPWVILPDTGPAVISETSDLLVFQEVVDAGVLVLQSDGVPGAPGAPGANGQDGQDGADGTLPDIIDGGNF